MHITCHIKQLKRIIFCQLSNILSYFDSNVPNIKIINLISIQTSFHYFDHSLEQTNPVVSWIFSSSCTHLRYFPSSLYPSPDLFYTHVIYLAVKQGRDKRSGQEQCGQKNTFIVELVPPFYNRAHLNIGGKKWKVLY